MMIVDSKKKRKSTCSRNNDAVRPFLLLLPTGIVSVMVVRGLTNKKVLRVVEVVYQLLQHMHIIVLILLLLHGNFASFYYYGDAYDSITDFELVVSLQHVLKCC